MSDLPLDWERNGAGTPFYYFVRGLTSINLYPKPTSSGADDLLVYYAAYPDHATLTDQTFFIPYAYERAIVAYGCMRISLKDIDREGANRLAFYTTEWQRYIEKLKNQVYSYYEKRVIRYGWNRRRSDTADLFCSINTQLQRDS